MGQTQKSNIAGSSNTPAFDARACRTNENNSVGPIVTIHDLARCLIESGQIDAILLDFSKAFDKVPHARLAKKLNNYGVRGKTLD